MIALCRHHAQVEIERQVKERTREVAAAEERSRQAAARADRLRAQMAAVFEAMSEGVFVFDLQGNAVLVNEAHVRLAGFSSAAEMMKGSLASYAELYELTTLDGTPVPVEQWPAARVLRGETLSGLELVGRRKDSDQRWVFAFSGSPVPDDDGQPALAVVITRDVSHAKRGEARLLESERRFRFLADHLPQIVWTANPDGYLDYYNERWYEFTGLPRGEGGDGSWKPILHPEDQERCDAAWYHSVATAEPYQIEYRFNDRKAGSYRWFLGRALPLRDEAGRVVKWFGSCTDIHDQKETEEKLAAALHIREDFVAIAAHELKTPLSALLMHVQSLQRARRAAAVPVNLDERLDKAARAGRRMDKLLAQMLDVSRITSGRLRLELEPLELRGLVEEVTRHFAEQVQRVGSSLHVTARTRAFGLWDRLRMEQAFTNLLANAVKYGEGKPIDVELREEEGHAVVLVTDRGIGIDPSQQKVIFERFERAVGTREFGGFGLGLWITRQLAEASGGRIEVESTLGQGSTFILRLPIQPTEEPPAHP